MLPPNPRPSSVAIVAKSIAAITSAAFILRNIAPWRACAVVVVHALISWFFDLIDRMERWNSRHCEDLSWLGFRERNATSGERAGSSSPVRHKSLSESYTH